MKTTPNIGLSQPELIDDIKQNTIPALYNNFGIIDQQLGNLSKRIIEYAYFVTDPTYGADKTGVTDSTTAIQNAVNACSVAGGGIVFLPAGTYRTSSAIILKSNVIIMGAGKGITFIQNNGTGNAIDALGTASPWLEIQDAGIRDLTINGSANSGHGFNGFQSTNNVFLYRVELKNNNIGIKLDTSWTVKIIECAVTNNRGNGINITNNSNNVSITKSLIKSNGGIGIYSSSRQILIQDNNLESNTGNQIEVYGRSVTIKENYIEAIPAGVYGIRVGNGSNGLNTCSIRDNYFYTATNNQTFIYLDNAVWVTVQDNDYDILSGTTGVVCVYLTSQAWACQVYVNENAVVTNNSTKCRVYVNTKEAVPKGTTANRPSGIMAYVGLMYLDTTLATNGKSIWWNGVGWVDANNVAPENRGINVAVSASATTLAVTFATTESDANYAVNVSPTWNTSYWITSKTTTGFTINFGTAPGSASTLDWTIKR